jgi:hypothetical protein
MGKLKQAKDQLIMTWKYTSETARTSVITKFDNYRLTTYAILICLIPTWLYYKKWDYLIITLCTIHIHIMMNQLYWRQASLEHHIENARKPKN